MRGSRFVLGSGLALALATTAICAPPQHHVLKQAKLGGEGGWDCLRVDAAARRVYISRGTHVMVVDADTQAVVGDIPDTSGVHDVALVPKLGRGFISCGRTNTVMVIDTKTLKKIDEVAVGERPDVMAFDPASGRVFSFNGGSNDATALDAKTCKVVGTVKLGGKPEFAVSDGKGTMFVNIEDKSEIVRFDPYKLEVLSHWSIAPGDGPSGLAIDVKHHRLFSVCGNQMMVVVDSVTGKVIATPKIGNGPDGVAFDAARGLAYSPNGADGTMTVVREVSPDTFEVVATVPTQRGARTMALDEKTHHLILITAEFQPGEGRRRPMVPGTFTLLEVGEK